MTINVDISPQDLAALKRLAHLEDDAEVVVWATGELLRLARLRELKSVSGKADFDTNWPALERGELNEFPVA